MDAQRQRVLPFAKGSLVIAAVAITAVEFIIVIAVPTINIRHQQPLKLLAVIVPSHANACV